TYEAAEPSQREFGTICDDVAAASIRRSLVGRGTFTMLTVLGAIGVATAYGLGGQLAISRTISIGSVVAVGVYLGRLLEPLTELSGLRAELESSVVALERLCSLVGDDDVLLSPHPAAPVTAPLLRMPDDRGTTLRSVNASFAYPGDAGLGAVRGVDLELTRGSVTGVVGATGAGKTTLGLLLAGLLEPTDGTVVLDRPGGAASGERLARHAVYVAQDPFLFRASVADNIRFGAPWASDGDVQHAARLAGIHERIDQLPERYATIVGDRGMTLSGGERQRISLARALLREPAVLVLDEASAHLDSVTERDMHQRLAETAAGRITVIIAHRLTTVQSADRIVVMEAGEIRESGSHDELLSTGGLYGALWSGNVHGGEARDVERFG
ncbi:MAG TPA: ABC transporter ATP-binding protein, partial [Acidimicrobiales bacterium]